MAIPLIMDPRSPVIGDVRLTISNSIWNASKWQQQKAYLGRFGIYHSKDDCIDFVFQWYFFIYKEAIIDVGWLVGWLVGCDLIGWLVGWLNNITKM